MAAEVDLLTHSWSFPEYASQNQSQEEPVREQGSISFGRYEKESLCWEKKSVFTHDRRKEELNKLTLPGSVAQKKAYFEQYYAKVRSFKGLGENNQPSIQSQTSTEILNSNQFQTSSDIQTGNEIGNSNVIENSDEIEISDKSENSDVIQTKHENESPDEIETANEMENSDIIDNSDEIENSNAIQISDEILVSNGEIQIPNGSISNSNSAPISLTEIRSEEEEREESTNNNIMIHEEPVPAVPTLPVRLVRSEKKEKLFRAFDDLSKDWVKLKKGMLPFRRNTGAELQNYQKSENFKNCKNGMGIAIKRSFGTVKDVINNSQKKESNVDKHKSSKTQLKPIKESQKSSFKTANLVPKTLKIGTTSTRSSTASSCNKPVLFGKSYIGTKSKEKSVVSSSTENNKKSVRSSWENLMRPTAASKARADITDIKRTNIGVRKPVSKATRPLKRDSSVQTNPRSFSRNKTRPNSEKTLRASERKKIMEKKVISSGAKHVVAKKISDSNIRLRKVLSTRTETVSINKRTKISATLSLNNNKKQRHERPAWR